MTTKPSKHTPELFFKATASDSQGVIYSEDGRTIAVIYDRKDGYGELFANAPKLLEAINRLLACPAMSEDSEENGTIAARIFAQRAIAEVGGK